MLRGWLKMHDRFIADGRWYYTLTVLTAGLFAWVPFLHAGAKTHDDRQRRPAALYGALAVGLAVMAGITPTDAQGDPQGAFGALLSTVVGVAAIVIIAAACLQLRPLRLAAYGLHDSHRVGPAATDRAVTQALAARQRRQEARALAERDPSLARDLSIGRPDRARDYDDGGLVDLNSSSAELLVSVCGLDKDSAERLVGIRQQWATGFTSVEEALAYVELSERDANVLRDRGMVLPN
jgi:DNA uptake protein ComE-like DNA-binding protein